MTRVSAGTKWIAAIIGLLGANLLAMAILIGAANAGRSQVLPQYYERAVHYDDAIDQAARNRALGWRVTARWDDGLAVDVTDRDGQALRGVRMHVVATPRTAAQRRGVHDVTVVVDHGGSRFVQTMTVEAR